MCVCVERESLGEDGQTLASRTKPGPNFNSKCWHVSMPCIQMKMCMCVCIGGCECVERESLGEDGQTLAVRTKPGPYFQL